MIDETEQPVAAGNSTIEVHRALGWRPVSAAPVMRPDSALTRRIGPKDNDAANVGLVHDLLPETHRNAFVEARFANRFDGLLLLDVYVDTAKLPKAPKEHRSHANSDSAKDEKFRQTVINDIIDACGDIAKVRAGHNHYFHGRKTGNDVQVSKGDLYLLYILRLVVLVVLVFAIIQWNAVKHWEPGTTWVLPIAGAEFGPIARDDVAAILLILTWTMAIVLIGEITWWTRFERVWNGRDLSLKGVSHFVRTDHATQNAEGTNTSSANPGAPYQELPSDESRISWFNDTWIAAQKTLLVGPGAETRKDRLALIQLRRTYLKLIETVSHQINESIDLERKPKIEFYTARIAWRVITILGVALIVLLFGALMEFDWGSRPYTYFLVAFAIVGLAVLAHSLLLSTTSVRFRVEHLRNVRGFFSFASALGPVIEQVMRYGSKIDPKHAERPAMTPPDDPFRVDSFSSSADIVQVMIDREEHTLRLLQFRAGVAAAVLALISQTLFDRLAGHSAVPERSGTPVLANAATPLAPSDAGIVESTSASPPAAD